MNKYELAVVVNAKLEDEERAAVVDSCKALIERFGGTITNVDDWGKKRLAYEVQKMKEGFYYFIQFLSTPFFHNLIPLSKMVGNPHEYYVF